MKFISNLKPSWAGILAIAVACSVISYHNNKLAEETKKDQYIHQINIPTVEEVFEPAVKSFDELLDAYYEVREPINYYRNKHSAVFLIIHNNMAWMYTLMNYDK